MKKIVAISVMFALVAAAAFAQPSVGGQFKAGVNLLMGTNEKEQMKDNSYTTGADFGSTTGSIGAEPQKYEEKSQDFQSSGRTAGWPKRTMAYLNLKFGDAEMGGYARFHASRAGDWYGDSAFAFMWWRPSEFFRIQIGRNADADWGAANLTGWGFNGEAQDFVALDNDSQDGLASSVTVARRTGFYGGIQGDSAVLTSLYPIEGLTINLGLPWRNGADDPYRAADAWLRFHAQVRYDLEEVGSIFVTYEGQGQAQKQIKDRVRTYASKSDMEGDKVVELVWMESLDSVNFGKTVGFKDDFGKEVYGIESPKLWLSFYGNKIMDGLAFDVGVGYQPKLQSGNTPPIEIGLGATYAVNEEFGIKFRTGAKLGEKKRGQYSAESWERVTWEESEAQWIDGKVEDPIELDDVGNAKILDKKASDREITKDGNLWDEWSTGTEIGFQILPYYKLSSFTVYLNAGIGLKFLPTDAGNPNRKFSDEEIQKRQKDLDNKNLNWSQNHNDNRYIDGVAFDDPKLGALKTDKYYKPEATTTEVSWYINPYIRKSVNGASLMAGVKVWSNGADKYAGEKEWTQLKNADTDKGGDGKVYSGKYYTSAWHSKISWAIPIGVNVYF